MINSTVPACSEIIGISNLVYKETYIIYYKESHSLYLKIF